MKRTLALFLSFVLTAAAVLPVLADNRAVPAPSAADSQQSTASSASGSAASSGEASAESAAGSTTLPQTPAADGQTASSEQGGDPLAFLTAQSVQSEQLKSENSAGTLHFESLRAALNKYNENILSLEGQIKDLADASSSTSGLWDAIVGIQGKLDDVYRAITLVEKAKESLGDAYEPLSIALTSQYAILQMQVTTMQGQRDSIIDSNDSIESAKNTLNDAINQVVKGAETLYIAILTMQDGLDAMERGLETLDRAVAITEKQQELGMASAYDVEKMRHQRSQLQSQIESMKFQITSSKLTLEGMCGMELNGTVELAPLPELTDAQLDAVNYDKALSTAMGRNVDVMNAEIKFNSDSGGVNRHSLAAAKRSFAASFKTVCLTIPEDRRLVAAAQETVDFQQRTFDIAAKKYELGMLSHEEYLSAQNDLTSTQDDLRSAKRDLFSAYRAYENAVQYGLI